MPLDILIDTDPGIDDAVALALAAALDQLQVVAITTVHGNTDVARATRNAREVAAIAGLRAPVTAGAGEPLARLPHPARETHGEEGLGFVRPRSADAPEADTAAEVILTAAIRYAPLTLCMLGPLTNLAHALHRAPEAARTLGPVYIMGGTVGVKGTMTAYSEFNWWADPEAVDVVLRAGLDVRLVPLDVTRRIAIPGSAIRALETAGRADRTAAFWADALRFYADFHESYESFDGCVVNDALAVALVADPSLATWRDMRITVSLSDDERRGALVPALKNGASARVAFDVRARDMLHLLGRRVFGRWLPPDELVAGADAAERWLASNPVGGASR